METLRIAATESKAPDAPVNTKESDASASNALKGVVSENDAIQSTNNATIPTLQPLGGTSAPTGNSVAVGELVNGKFAVELMDAFLPSLFVVTMYSVGMVMKKSDLQLTERERSTIAPLLQKCLDSLQINFSNPWQALGYSLLFIYGSKIMQHGGVAWLDKLSEKMNREKDPKLADKKPAKVVPISNEKQPEQAANIADTNSQVSEPPVENWQPSEQMIIRAMKSRKCSRLKAVAHLQMKYSKGKLK